MNSLKTIRTNLQASKRSETRVITSLRRPLTADDFRGMPERSAIISKKENDVWSEPNIATITLRDLEAWNNHDKCHGALKVWNFADEDDPSITLKKLKAAHLAFKISCASQRKRAIHMNKMT
jgi:hypothetical protein